MTTITVSNASQLQSALAAAKPGDVVLLANGEYGTVTIDRNYSADVTIKAQNPLGAKFDQIIVNNSSHLVFDGIHVDSPSNGTSGPGLIDINSSDHITVMNCEMNGKVDAVYPIAGWFGVRTDDSSFITVANNDIHDVQNGLSMVDSSNLVVRDNFVDRVGSDFYKFAAVDSVLIENNTGGGHTFAAPDAHEDFMQFQGAASSNVTIRGNVFLVQNSAGVQGIFVSGNGGHRNILIEDNIIYTGMYNGILVNSGTGIVVRDNTVLNASGTVHTSTQIVVPSGAVVENNITTSYKGGMSGSNLVLDANNAGSAYYYDKFLANADAGLDVTLADLLPKAGTLAATKGAWQHLNELLSGNGSSSSGNTDGGQTGNGGGTTDPDTPPPPPPPPEPEVADLIYALNGNREFDGSRSAVISVDHRRAFETDQGTIAFSFNADNVTRHQGLVSKDANGFVDGGNHMTILINNGELRAWFEDGDSSVRLSVGGLKANREYDVVATFDHDTVKLFLDGKLVDSEQFVMNWEDNDQTLLIGGNGRTSTASETKITSAFDGTITDLHIYNQDLAPWELALIN